MPVNSALSALAGALSGLADWAPTWERSRQASEEQRRRQQEDAATAQFRQQQNMIAQQNANRLEQQGETAAARAEEAAKAARAQQEFQRAMDLRRLINESPAGMEISGEAAGQMNKFGTDVGLQQKVNLGQMGAPKPIPGLEGVFSPSVEMPRNPISISRTQTAAEQKAAQELSNEAKKADVLQRMATPGYVPTENDRIILSPSYQPRQEPADRLTETFTGTDAKGNPQFDVIPMKPGTKVTHAPPAAQAAANAPVPEIVPGTPEYKIADDLGSGKLNFANFARLFAYSRDAKKREGIYVAASTLHPDFSAADYERAFKVYTNPAVSRQLSNISNADKNLQSMVEASNAVKRSDFPALNSILLNMGFQMGDKPITDLKTMRILLGDDVSLALGVGSASDLKTQLGMAVTDPVTAPANYKSQMDKIHNFLTNRARSYTQQMGVYGGNVLKEMGFSPAGTEGGATVRMLSPDGKLYDVSPADAAEGLKHGWQKAPAGGRGGGN